MGYSGPLRPPLYRRGYDLLSMGRYPSNRSAILRQRVLGLYVYACT